MARYPSFFTPRLALPGVTSPVNSLSWTSLWAAMICEDPKTHVFHGFPDNLKQSLTLQRDKITGPFPHLGTR